MDNRIGAQYFTVRDFTTNTKDFAETCKKISDIGYKNIQISCCPLKAKEIKPIIDEYGLTVVTTHRNFDDFKADIDEIIDYNKTLGVSLCGIGMMPFDNAKSYEATTEFIKDSYKACEELKKENMFLGYHNHSFEFVKYNGKTVFDRLIEETDKETFMFIADVYWLQAGGVVPQEMIKRLGKRAMAVHFKDYGIGLDSWEIPKMKEIGNGNLFWDEIIKACEEAGTKWAIVEQDSNWIDNNPFTSLKVSYDFLKTKGFI